MEFVMTNRTQRLIAGLFAHPREISLERALLYTESHKRTEGEPDDDRRAKATAWILDHVQISIRDDELIGRQPDNQTARRHRLARDGPLLVA